MRLESSYRKALVAAIFLAIITGLVLDGAELAAQSVSATIRGNIRDSSGGVIAGARVTLRDTEKGVLYQTLTDYLGLYQLATPVGNYEVEITASGFTAAKVTAISLSVGQTLASDFTLEVSGPRESIEVKAAVPLVDTANGTLSGLVDRERLAALPLNGRDFGNLALLEPGVVPNNNGANAPFGGKWANFLINGQSEHTTLFLIDGSEVNDSFSGRNPGGSSGVLLGLDSVQEFQVLLNSYKAEFGKNSGSVIHVATRSGSNQLHGSAYEYLRNSVLDAKNFFDLPGSIPPFRRNQFGASLGGPIRKDRTFFFLNYEGLRERKAITSVAIVPPAAARSAAVPEVVPFLSLYPLPNGGPSNPNNLTSAITQPAREDYGLARVDHRLSERTSVLARFSTQDSFITPPFPSTPVPGFPQDLPHRSTYATLGLTSAFHASAINEFHFAFNRTFGAILLPPPPNGLTISPVAGRKFGLIIVNGISNLGTQTFVPQAAINDFEIADSYSYRRGRHSQKYGISIQRYQGNEQRGTFFNGQYSFTGLPQFLAANPASFVGVLGGNSASGAASAAGWRWITYGAYAQDDFQARSNLTLNFGIRYEFSTPPGEVNGQIANLHAPLDPQITYGGQLFNTISRSFAPRFGFSWSPLPNQHASLRGGYGIFFNPLVVNMWGNSRLVLPYVNTVSIVGGPPFPNPLSTGRATPLSTTGQSIQYDLSQPYSQQWNLQWQQAISSNWVAKAGYVGNRSLHLIRSLESNSAFPTLLADGRKCFNYPAASGGPNPLCPNGPTTRRNPAFGAIRGRTSDGDSWYDALQMTLEKRYAQGWGFQVSYTWGKSLDTTDSSFTVFPTEPTNTQDPENPFMDKGLSIFDVRHRLVANFLWQVPQFHWPDSWNWLLGGWRMSEILSVSSGYPFTVIDGFNRSGNLQSDSSIIADRPNWNSNFQGNTILGDPYQWFNPAAFALQPSGFYGNVPRNALTGPGFRSIDFSWSKKFPIKEPQELEFRADVFNLLNHPNFATPSSPTGAQVTGGVIVFADASGSLGGRTGQIFRTVTESRQIQFSLRYRF